MQLITHFRLEKVRIEFTSLPFDIPVPYYKILFYINKRLYDYFSFKNNIFLEYIVKQHTEVILIVKSKRIDLGLFYYEIAKFILIILLFSVASLY